MARGWTAKLDFYKKEKKLLKIFRLSWKSFDHFVWPSDGLEEFLWNFEPHLLFGRSLRIPINFWPFNLIIRRSRSILLKFRPFYSRYGRSWRILIKLQPFSQPFWRSWKFSVKFRPFYYPTVQLSASSS